jgi:hypothetical protein
VFISLCFCLNSSQATHQFAHSSADSASRFIKLNASGEPIHLHDASSNNKATWACVWDSKTGLVWEVKTTHGFRRREHTYTWYNPRAETNGGGIGLSDGGHCEGSKCDTHSYINAVNHQGLCGHDDWRLPTREELRSIVDYKAQPPQPTINTENFPHTVAQFYWSATPDANTTDSAWGIGFTFGYDYSYFKRDFGYVRLVTSNSATYIVPTNRFEIRSDGNITDRKTRLVWQRCSVGQQWDEDKNTCSGKATPMTWYQASKRVKNWRLPTVQELSSITELRGFNPTIDRQVFPNTPPSHFWTSTAFANRTGHFWLVQFLSGENHTDSGKRLAYVRLVKQLKRQEDL